jgi:NDP-sugar pyrophosphorylase family protein
LGLEGNYIFCVKKEHEEKFKIIDYLQKIKPNCKVITIDYQTGGALETILHARQFIDNNEELIISDADHYLDWDSKNFQKNMIEKKLDACAMIFPEPRYEEKSSYVTLDNNGYVTKSAEKSRISDIALVGLHYFRNGSDFTKFADDVIKKNIKAKNEFYLSLIYNIYAEHRQKVITFPIRKMWPLGDPEEIKQFKKDFVNLKRSNHDDT